jgi:selenocysteine-specific elongation factor
LIVATAGHVDHGKTSLVKQLTGVDTDRLAEEKRRGLSINLGFAFRQVDPQTRLGFIDVPGHARFINTMIAGVSGIDLAMLVVAADDGVMPQTLEHLDILRILGIDEILPVLTCIDRVDPARLKSVSVELQALVANMQHPLFAVSNTTGEGLIGLQGYLDDRARAHRARKPAGNFRLPIDRAFVLKGAGLVLTGTAASGEVVLNDTLELLPQGIELRLRSLRVQDSETDRGQAGQRCALNVAGPVKQAQIRRGDVLVTADAKLPVTERFDGQLTLLERAPFALKHLSPVKVYLGSGRYAARAFLINRASTVPLPPGEEALVQLILDSPLACCRGDRFLLRDDSETVTLGGGVVLDPLAPRSKKSNPRRLHYLAAMSRETASEALRFLLQTDSPPAAQAATDLDAFRRSWNLCQDEFDELLQDVPLKCFTFEDTIYGMDEAAWQRGSTHILRLLDQWQSDHPGEQGIRPSLLQELARAGVAKGLVRAVLSEQLRQGTLKLTGGLLHRVNHKLTLSSGEQKHWDTIHNVLQRRGPNLPLVSELVAATGLEKSAVLQALNRAVRAGAAHKLNEQRYALPLHLHHYADIALSMAAEHEDITVVSYKVRIESGRKLAIELLEYFDLLRFTQRRGDSRTIIDKALPGRLFNN